VKQEIEDNKKSQAKQSLANSKANDPKLKERRKESFKKMMSEIK
jgi:hypothetical protein